MPSTYNGDATHVADPTQCSASVPVGSDMRKASTIVTPLEQLADFIQYLVLHYAGKALDNDFTGGNIFEAETQVAPGAFPDAAALKVGAMGASYTLIIKAPIATSPTVWWRLYAATRFGCYLTVNAQWSDGSPGYWSCDNSAAPAYRMSFAGGMTIGEHDATASSWADNAWTNKSALGLDGSYLDVLGAGGGGGIIQAAAFRDHYYGSAPQFVAGAGAGSGGSYAWSQGGTNLSGYIALTTGNSPSAGGVICTATLHAALPAYAVPTISPANANAAALSGTSQVYVELVDAQSWHLKAGGVALSANTPYTWHFAIGCGG